MTAEMNFVGRNILYIALIQAIIATVGSIYFSDFRHFAPCVLCWYQRILMYPLVIIISVGILRRDKYLYQYVLPLSVIGIVVSSYQALLQMGIIPETIAPCINGVSCLTKYISYFGFVTIPVLSLSAFVIITACMLIAKSNFKK